MRGVIWNMCCRSYVSIARGYGYGNDNISRINEQQIRQTVCIPKRITPRLLCFALHLSQPQQPSNVLHSNMHHMFNTDSHTHEQYAYIIVDNTALLLMLLFLMNVLCVRCD